MPTSRKASRDLVCVGRILGAHGVRGILKVHSFTEDPLTLFQFPEVRRKSGDVLCTFEGPATRRGTYQGYPFFLTKSPQVTSREQAQDLRGVFLYVTRASLPAIEQNAFYYHDLKGLWACDAEGYIVGRVRAVQDFGAGPLLEIQVVRDAEKPQTMITEMSTETRLLLSTQSVFLRFHDDHVNVVDTDQSAVILTRVGAAWLWNNLETSEERGTEPIIDNGTK